MERFVVHWRFFVFVHETSPVYDRPKHLTKFMKQWERGVPGPPDRVYIDIIRHYNNSRDTCQHDVKPTPIREALTQLGYREFRSFAERISNRLQNIPVAQLSPATIRQFSKLFALIQPIFVLVKERRYVVRLLASPFVSPVVLCMCTQIGKIRHR